MSDKKNINGHYTNVPAHLEEFCKDTKKLISYDQKLAAIPFEVLVHFAIDCVVVNHKHYNHILKTVAVFVIKNLLKTILKQLKAPTILLLVLSTAKAK